MASSTVLVVDDEIMTRTMLRMLLEITGYTVFEAEDGKIALEMVAEHQPQAMILDVMMPNLDGITVCRELRAREETAVLPIIVLSGGNYEEGASRGRGGQRIERDRPNLSKRRSRVASRTISQGHEMERL